MIKEHVGTRRKSCPNVLTPLRILNVNVYSCLFSGAAGHGWRIP